MANYSKPSSTPRMARLSNPPKPPGASGMSTPRFRIPRQDMAAQEEAVKANASTTLKSGRVKSLNQKLLNKPPDTVTPAYATAVSAQIAASVAAAQGGGVSQSAQVLPGDLDLAFRNNLLKAVKEAVDKFRLEAFFKDVSIHGIAAIGQAGCLHGPRLDPLISTAKSVIGVSDVQLEIREAVAAGVGDAFETWREGVTVPGLPWYPTFAAYPAAHTPPTANAPTPVGLCLSAGSPGIISGEKLQKKIKGELPDALKIPSVLKFTENVAYCLSAAFAAWLLAQSVSTVMGHGPVPSYAPPNSPVGPVVNGTVIASPGVLFFGGSFTLVMPPMP